MKKLKDFASTIHKEIERLFVLAVAFAAIFNLVGNSWKADWELQRSYQTDYGLVEINSRLVGEVSNGVFSAAQASYGRELTRVSPDTPTPYSRGFGQAGVIEQILGIVTDAETGKGLILNTDSEDFNFISYRNVEDSVTNGTVFLTYLVYDFNEDGEIADIDQRYDVVLSREYEVGRAYERHERVRGDCEETIFSKLLELKQVLGSQGTYDDIIKKLDEHGIYLMQSVVQGTSRYEEHIYTYEEIDNAGQTQEYEEFKIKYIADVEFTWVSASNPSQSVTEIRNVSGIHDSPQVAQGIALNTSAQRYVLEYFGS